jgi:hypothetical protein
MKPIAVCAIFKNEAPFLLEWIAFHRLIGVGHFVLYDNGSTDGGSALIAGSWAGSCCTIVDWPQRPGQLAAYRHFIYNFADSFSWVAFIDLDEFLLPLHQDDIRPILHSMAGFSAVLVQWRVFGPSGWMEPPDGLCIEAYDLRTSDTLPVNGHIKSVVRCADLLDVSGNAHEYQVRGAVCDTLGRPVANIAIQPAPCHQRLVINHYFTRSRQDWMAKLRRGSGMFNTAEAKYRAEVFDHLAEASQTRDVTIKRFVDRVRALLDSGAGCEPVDLEPVVPLAEAELLGIVGHIQIVGDVAGRAGEWVGRRGSGRWIEGISLTPGPGLAAQDIEYRVTLAPGRITRWLPAGMFAGTRGLGVPIFGFAVRLTGEAALRYECVFDAVFLDGSVATGAGPRHVFSITAPLEALRVRLRPRGNP